MKEYSAGIVSHAFWYDEFRQYIQLLNDGLTPAEIRVEVLQKNIFLASTPSRAKRMIGGLERRVAAINQDVLDIFLHLDIANQKVVDMISVMKTNKLIGEFMYEAYRSELILGDSVIEEHEYTAFFNKKQSESAEVAAWTDQTIHRIKGIIHTFLLDSGLVVERDGKDYLKRVQLNRQLRQLLINSGQQVIVDSITGEH